MNENVKKDMQLYAKGLELVKSDGTIWYQRNETLIEFVTNLKKLTGMDKVTGRVIRK